MGHVLDYFLLPGLAAALLVSLLSIYPLWRIVRRTGLKPYWSLWVLVPVAGFFIVGGALAFKPWPNAVKGGEA